MKFKIYILSLLVFFVVSGLMAQKGKEVEYSVLRNDPAKLTPVVLSLDFLTADTWNTNSYMGINIRPEINIPKYGQINIDYRRAFLDNNARGSDYLSGKQLAPEGKLKKHRSFEITFGINLLHKDKTKQLPVVLSTSRIYSGSAFNINSVDYIDVAGKVRTCLQARVGYQVFNSTIDLAEAENEGTGFRINNVLSPDSVFRFNQYTKLDGYSGIAGRTRMNFQVFNIGLSLKRITNLWVENNASASGISSNATTYDFYFDALVNLKTSFANFVTNANEYAITHANPRKLGWRMGWSAHVTRGAFMTYKVEVGARPLFKQDKKGILGDNAFLLLSAGWSFGIGSKLKLKRDA
jgi:hypothetical protein